ncbi:MAG: hypothetical protein HWE25_15425 [Alphaproteobacteria bacterium]|nr:hypothetical protein [Alphaproteobacteria bacterium]
MTSASILPSVGPPPPGFKRPNVPENLKPKIDDPVERLSRETPSSSGFRTKDAGREADKLSVRQGQDAKANSNTAVQVQVIEGRIPPSARQTTGPGEEPIVPQGVDDLAAPEEQIQRAGELSPEDETYVRELQARDREVRAHEAAHATAGSGYTSSPSFEYVTGPDGVQYAVGGHVSIDTSKVPDDPEATIQKMEVVRSAALAPARPSGQDRAVAAAAEQAIRQAQSELNAQKSAEQKGEEAESQLSGGIEAAAGNISDSEIQPSALQPQVISIDLIA